MFVFFLDHQNKQNDSTIVNTNNTIGTNEQPLQLEVDNVLESLAKGGQDQMFHLTGKCSEVEEEEDDDDDDNDDDESDNNVVHEEDDEDKQKMNYGKMSR